jgi:hypothetical protein
MMAILSGCQKAKERAVIAFGDHVVAQMKFEKEFRVIDGEVVFVDSDMGGGKVLRKVAEADTATFRSFPQPQDSKAYYACDDRNVFMAHNYQVQVIADADPQTFEIISPKGGFTRDAQRVYAIGVPLDGADPQTFKPLQTPFSRDETHVFFGLAPMPVEDISSWRPLNSGLRKEGGCDWSKDNLRVYWRSKPVPAADAITFAALGKNYGKDAQHVYYFGKLVTDADPTTFVVDMLSQGPRPDARDALREYRWGEPILKTNQRSTEKITESKD